MEEKEKNKTAEESVDYLDQYQRLQAEFINYRKRVEEQWAKQREEGVQSVLALLLPVLDDFNLFFGHHKNDKDQTVIIGVKMIYEKMMSSLTALGLTKVDTDSLFNPEYHEAVVVENKQGVPSGKILDVWQPGYSYKQKLLRPAKVKVAEAVEVREKNE
ncbi:nucleotide exchange factor GrpE [candidate division KSB1 bacterium]|nr:nucleotide exchange factor GrpE [candidate division KSB1 bacterium]